MEYINIELEQKVLKSLFWDKESLLTCSNKGMVNPDIFADKSFRIIFKMILSHFNKTGTNVSKALLVSKIERLRLKDKKLKDKDVEAYKEKLLTVVDKFLATKPLKKDLANFEVYFNELGELLKARLIQEHTIKLFNYLDNGKLEEAEQEVAAFLPSTLTEGVESAEITENFLYRQNYIMERKNNPDKYKLFPTGIIHLDQALGGGIGREFCLVGGSSNAGKSTFLQTVACNARRKGLNVILFTIEMQLLETQFKIDSNLAHVPYEFFRNPVEFYTEKFHQRWIKKIEKLKTGSGKLEVVAFEENATMSKIRSCIYQIMYKWQEPVHGIIIDYLDDIEPEKQYREYKNWASFGEISWDMHKLCKSFKNFDGTKGVPVISANQFRKDSKDVSSSADVQHKKKRKLDERDTGSSPLPYRHSDIYLGIQTVEENMLSNIVIMKGRFVDKASKPLLCFHNMQYGRFHDEAKKSEFREAIPEGDRKDLETIGIDLGEEGGGDEAQ